MRRTRWWQTVGAVAALVCTLGIVTVLVVRADPGVMSAAPLAVVLVPSRSGSELVSVDLGSGRIAGRVRLRSLATDIDVDPASGTVVAAQTGGLGDDADDALSFTDPRSRRVNYVRLPQADPSQVECVSGRAMVLHAVVDARGFVTSAVELSSEKGVTGGHAPDGTGLWAACAGSLWTSIPAGGEARFSLVRVDPATLATSAGPGLGFSPNSVVPAGDGALVLGGSQESDSRVALLGSGLGSVTASAPVAGLPHGAQLAVTIGDAFVIGDWNGEVPETATLKVLDRTSLTLRKTLHPGGAPCALATYDGSLLVVDRVSGTLVRLDPLTGHVEWRADLGATELVCSKVVVIPAVATRTAGG